MASGREGAPFSEGTGVGVRNWIEPCAPCSCESTVQHYPLEDTCVDEIDFGPDDVKVSTTFRERRIQWSAQVVIGADGRNSVVKRSLDP